MATPHAGERAALRAVLLEAVRDFDERQRRRDSELLQALEITTQRAIARAFK